MSGPLTIRDGQMATKDPSDVIVYVFDWDTEHLAQGVTISSQNVTITGMSGDLTTTPLAISDQGILAGSGSRKVQVRLTGGAAGSKWRVNSFIQTNESPDQRFERSFILKVEQL